MDLYLQLLGQVSIFSSLDDLKIKEISTFIAKRTYKKNEVIFHQNDEGNSLFILRSGSVKISIVDESGREVILKTLSENDFFGEMSLLDGRPRSAKVTALEKSTALLIYRSDFTRLITENSEIASDILAYLSLRLRDTNERVADLSFFDAYGKTAKVLLKMASEHGIKEGKHTCIESPLNRQEMAETAGLSRETFSRMLKEFHLRGCLNVDGKKIIILNETILKRECSQSN